ncbi:hypothetical protein [Nonomuraea sp. WAC 01424]|nr:hypothetical protein [Nonomuraea sp. WAC 01424]
MTTGSPYTEPTHHRAGRVLDLWQTGRKDWPVDTLGRCWQAPLATTP